MCLSVFHLPLLMLCTPSCLPNIFLFIVTFKTLKNNLYYVFWICSSEQNRVVFDSSSTFHFLVLNKFSLAIFAVPNASKYEFRC